MRALLRLGQHHYKLIKVGLKLYYFQSSQERTVLKVTQEGIFLGDECGGKHHWTWDRVSKENFLCTYSLEPNGLSLIDLIKIEDM